MSVFYLTKAVELNSDEKKDNIFRKIIKSVNETACGEDLWDA